LSARPISRSTDPYPVNLRDITLRNAHYYGGRAAVVFENRRCTHAESATRAFRLANALLARGLRRERVAVLAPNCPEYLEIFSACESANLVIVNMNYRLSAKELIDIGRDCEPSAFIFHAQFKDLAGELLRAVGTFRTVVSIGGSYHGAEAYETVADGCCDAPPDVAIDDKDVAYLIYTSGTTGRSKGVMLSHAAIVESARCISHEGGARSDDVMLIVMPLFHIGARIEQLAFAILGATIVLHGSFDAAAILRSIGSERVTAVHLAPIMVQRLLDSPELAAADKSRLRCIHYASAPMPVPTLRRAIAAFGPILTQIYGMTECIVASLLTPVQHNLEGSEAEMKRLASAGQAFLGCSIRIIRPDGAEAATGEVGEILIRSPGIMNGYWNNPTATSSTLRGGWMHTGDLGYLDADNFVFVVDRKKDMIISGGENIYSWEVEEALRSHPSVAEAAVIGVPDAEWGESVKAFVVRRYGERASAEELIKHCRSLIASYKKPRTVDFVDALPRSFNGKIDKKALRAPFWAQEGETSR
jgi:acyl-CoA synthetase (AMP-forming)/AMP-acid ligase II